MSVSPVPLEIYSPFLCVVMKPVRFRTRFILHVEFQWFSWRFVMFLKRDREWHDSAACQVQRLCFAVLHTPNTAILHGFFERKRTTTTTGPTTTSERRTEAPPREENMRVPREMKECAKKGSDRPDIHDGIGITSTKHFFVRTSDRRCRAMLSMTEQRDEQPSFC